MKRRRHIVRNVDGAQLFVAREILIRRVDHAFQVGLVELESRQLHRIRDHRDCERLRAGVLHPGPQNPRRERAAQADAREVRHEPSSRFIQVGQAA